MVETCHGVPQLVPRSPFGLSSVSVGSVCAKSTCATASAIAHRQAMAAAMVAAPVEPKAECSPVAGEELGPAAEPMQPQAVMCRTARPSWPPEMLRSRVRSRSQVHSPMGLGLGTWNQDRRDFGHIRIDFDQAKSDRPRLWRDIDELWADFDCSCTRPSLG